MVRFGKIYFPHYRWYMIQAQVPHFVPPVTFDISIKSSSDLTWHAYCILRTLTGLTLYWCKGKCTPWSAVTSGLRFQNGPLDLQLGMAGASSGVNVRGVFDKCEACWPAAGPPPYQHVKIAALPRTRRAVLEALIAENGEGSEFGSEETWANLTVPELVATLKNMRTKGRPTVAHPHNPLNQHGDCTKPILIERCNLHRIPVDTSFTCAELKEKLREHWATQCELAADGSAAASDTWLLIDDGTKVKGGQAEENTEAKLNHALGLLHAIRCIVKSPFNSWLFCLQKPLQSTTTCLKSSVPFHLFIFGSVHCWLTDLMRFVVSVFGRWLDWQYWLQCELPKHMTEYQCQAEQFLWMIRFVAAYYWCPLVAVICFCTRRLHTPSQNSGPRLTNSNFNFDLSSLILSLEPNFTFIIIIFLPPTTPIGVSGF